MEPISDYMAGQAQWVQPRALGRHFELHAGEALLATLTFPSAWNYRATAETAAGVLTLRREGFWKNRVLIEDDGGEVAHLVRRFWGSGNATFADGTAFTWQPANFWQTDWMFRDEAGATLLTFHRGVRKGGLAGAFKSQATLDIAAVGKAGRYLPVLAVLGMYLRVIQDGEAAAAAA